MLCGPRLARCTGCNACVEACMFRAVRLGPLSGRATAGEAEVLADLPKRACVKCGESHASASRDVCPACRPRDGLLKAAGVPARSAD